MPKVKISGESGEFASIQCPACREPHTLRIAGPRPWSWNGDSERPTFGPSILATSGHYVSGAPQPPDCHICNEPSWPWPCARCHSFVRDGRIEFLSDCSHELAGRTVDLCEVPE